MILLLARIPSPTIRDSNVLVKDGMNRILIWRCCAIEMANVCDRGCLSVSHGWVRARVRRGGEKEGG